MGKLMRKLRVFDPEQPNIVFELEIGKRITRMKKKPLKTSTTGEENAS
jgi:hypothetical protein